MNVAAIRGMRRVAVWAALVFALDQATKWAVVQGLNLKDIGEYDVLDPFFGVSHGVEPGCELWPSVV